MQTSNPWRRLISTAQIDELGQMKTASAVARVLKGQPRMRPPEFTGSSPQDLAKHRIEEIERNYEPEWPDMRDPVQLGNHHARDVARRAEGHTRDWSWNCQHGGWRDQPSAVRTMVMGLRDRVDAALHAAKREFDPEGQLRKHYEMLEAEALARIDDIETKCAEERAGASAHYRRKLRRQEAEELQEVLDALAVKVRSWADSYPVGR